MRNKGIIEIGWFIALGLASVGVIFGYGKLAQSVDEIKANQIQQTEIVKQLTKNETDILILLGRQDEKNINISERITKLEQNNK